MLARCLCTSEINVIIAGDTQFTSMLFYIKLEYMAHNHNKHLKNVQSWPYNIFRALLPHNTKAHRKT